MKASITLVKTAAVVSSIYAAAVVSNVRATVDLALEYNSKNKMLDDDVFISDIFAVKILSTSVINGAMLDVLVLN